MAPRGSPKSVQQRARQALFLKVFARHGTITGACMAMKMDRSFVYTWRKTDPEFEKQFQEVKLDEGNLLEDTTMKDALGDFNPETGEYKKGDPILKMFLLKANNPAKYRDNIKLLHDGVVTLKDLVLDDPK